MAEIVYTKAVQNFAQKFDGGLASLGATVEAEIERECGLPGSEDYIPFSDFIFHTFSWHGDLNMIMSPKQGEDVIIVDMVDDDDPDTITVEAGPLEGQTLIVPKPVTQT